MITIAEPKETHLLSATQLNEFFKKAALIGHDTVALQNNEELTSFFTVNDFSSAKAILSNATDAQRELRLATFFNATLLNRVKLGQGKHDRGEAVAFANAPVSDADAKGISRHFPLRVKSISVLHKTVHKGETWDVSTSGADWGVDEMEELYTVVNVGKLTLEEDAKLVIRGNVFSLLCQTLVAGEGKSAYHYHIGILPTPTSVDFGHGPHNGLHGIDGRSGDNGMDGSRLEVRNTIIGPMLIDEGNLAKVNGANGESGLNGTDGIKGRNGGMCKLAELTVRNIEGQLKVFSQAGAGGDGGDGGNGGQAGSGGEGMPGAKGFDKSAPGGNGGDGGNGGNGGKGGHAGHGGVASNIYLSVPLAIVDRAVMQSFNSVGGIGGKGGKAGQGGKGGAAQPAEIMGAEGKCGNEGTRGKDGVFGRGRDAAVLYLNDVPYQPTQNLKN